MLRLVERRRGRKRFESVCECGRIGFAEIMRSDGGRESFHGEFIFESDAGTLVVEVSEEVLGDARCLVMTESKRKGGL